MKGFVSVVIFSGCVYLWFCPWPRPRTVGQIIDAMEIVAPFAKWLAGINGVGWATSMGLQIAAYTSLATVSSDRLCASIYFMYESVNAGRVFGGFFIFAGLLALLAVAVPSFIVHRTEIFFRPRSELVDFTDNYFFILGAQLLMVAAAMTIPAVLLLQLTFSFNPTHQVIMDDWSKYDRECAKPSNSLQISIPTGSWRSL